jgi:Ca-activated chloride channel family protein
VAPLAQAWVTMLTPTSAVWAACICVPLLICLYILKLRRRPVRVSTSLFWARAAVDIEANVPWRRPRLSWLFALHLLIVLLLCAAVGRPALTGGGLPPDELVIVIDRSATMAATDAQAGANGGPRTRMDDAKDEAGRLLEAAARAGRTVRATLVSFASEARVDAGPTEDISLVNQTLRALEADDQPGNLNSAMNVLAGLNAATTSDAPSRRRVVLFGDGNWRDSEADAPPGLEFMQVGPKPGTATGNLGIAACAARRDDVDPTRVRVFVRVVNADGQPKATVVTLALNGTTLEQRAVTVAARTGATPGQASITMTSAAPAGGVLTVSLPAGDALASDDIAGVTLLPPNRPTVLIIGPDVQMARAASGVNSAKEEASALLVDVVNQLPTASVRRMSLTQWDQQGRPLAAVLLFDDVAPAVVPDAPTLSLGGGLPSAGLRLVTPLGQDNKAPLKRTRVVSWNRAHPALKDLTLDGLVADVALGFDDANGVADLALGDLGPLIRESRVAGRPHIVVAFGLSQANWALQMSFPLFVAQAIESLTRAELTSAGLRFSTTQPVELDATGTRVKLTGPRTTEAPAMKEGTTARAAMGILSRAGVYVVTGATVPAIVASVLDDGVSGLATRDQITIGGRVFDAGKSAAGPVEVWSWLLLTAALLLGAEWFIFARSIRPESGARL